MCNLHEEQYILLIISCSVLQNEKCIDEICRRKSKPYIYVEYFFFPKIMPFMR